MKGLVLYGLHCQLWIWDEIRSLCDDLDLTFMAYPHEVTSTCNGVHDLSEWVIKNAFSDGQRYDVVIGHSMGGNIALELSSIKSLGIKKTILIETSIRPSGSFYHNLLTDTHRQDYGLKVQGMLEEERQFSSKALQNSFRIPFDYSPSLMSIDHPVIAIYGDRGHADYPMRVSDLNLTDTELQKLELVFIEDACHMPMLENPVKLATLLHRYCQVID